MLESACLDIFKCRKANLFVSSNSFLCGYVYLRSLDRNADRTLFVHVPKVNEPYSSAEISRAILRTIELCMDQINQRNCNPSVDNKL